MDRVLRILQVEDSQDDAELIVRELRRGGHAVETARVETAAAMVNALCDKDWDLVLSDYELPGFGGLEALRVLQASGVDIPFILVSGAIGEEIAVTSMKAGAHDYVFKGNLARLSPAIDRELKEADIRRKQQAAASALRESEQRYRDLFEHSPMPISVEDFSGVKQIFVEHRRAGVQDFRAFFTEHPEQVRRCAAAVRMVDMNERSLAYFGCRRKDDIPLSLPMVFLESSWASFKEELITLAEGGQVFQCEIPVRDWKGDTRVVSLNLSVSPGFEKSLGRVLVSFLDISQRIDMEHSLLEVRTSLERAQGMAHIGSWEWEPARELWHWSAELYRIFGLDPAADAPSYDRFIGMVHPDDRAQVLGALETVIADGTPFGLEYRMFRTDGELRHVHERAEKVPGKAQILRGTIQDITERKRAEAARMESEARLRQAAEATGFGVYSWEFATQDAYYSPEFLKIYGLLPGQKVEVDEDLAPRSLCPEDKHSFLARMAAANDPDGNGLLENDYRIVRADGQVRWLRARGRTTFSGRIPTRANGIIQDITERRQLESVLKDMEKLSAKGQMAAYIAHEINNPLAGIKNAFALIEGAIPGNHPHYKYVELIKREIDRIAGIIRTMYHVYRPQNTAIADVSLVEAFQDIKSLLVPKCRAAGVEIAIELEDWGFVVRMNPGLLRQVLFNLVQNAVEASSNGGVVTLKAMHGAGEILISVEDLGQGIPPEEADRIFEAGFTTKRDSGMSGLGLGLSACRNIMESIGGSLVFEPNLDRKGVTFQIRIPDAPV